MSSGNRLAYMLFPPTIFELDITAILFNMSTLIAYDYVIFLLSVDRILDLRGVICAPVTTTTTTSGTTTPTSEVSTTVIMPPNSPASIIGNVDI